MSGCSLKMFFMKNPVKNLFLHKALWELDWSHGRLVTELNAILGPNYVGRSTVSEWVNHSRVPRDPVPTVVAHVLSEALGRDVSVEHLWQGRARSSQLWLPAFEGLAAAEWDHAGAGTVIADWVNRGEGVLDFDRRTFLSSWGASLTLPAWAYVDSLVSPLAMATAEASSRRGRSVTPAMMTIWENTVEQLRYLDDREGGNLENLRFAHRYLLMLGEHLKAGEASDASVNAEMLRLWMYLCQIAGWMAYDAEQHGLAQRYFYSGLHAARSAGDATYGAYLLAHLAHQAIYRGKPKEATELANAASEVSRDSPLALRALVNALLAHTEALAGNAHGFEATIDSARSMIDTPEAVQTRPAWLYWFDTEEFLARQGHGLLALARASSRSGRNHWLVKADELLTPKAVVTDSCYPREAVYNRLWLARSSLWRGELDRALDTASDTLAAEAVRSPRSVALLRRLDAELGERHGASVLHRVAVFRRQLRTAIK